MDYSRFMSMDAMIKKWSTKNLISEAINRDRQDDSAANEWASGFGCNEKWAIPIRAVGT